MIELGDPRLAPRFWGKVRLDPETGCWLWVAGTRSGYGSYWLNGRDHGAHTVAYRALVGPVLVGLELDHLCRVTVCVNPRHLEPVTHAENMRRGDVWKYHAAKTHCPSGHPYSDDNTYRWRGKRQCRVCRKGGVEQALHPL